ncbi:unnamed protein product [Pleuronectes platessa]|uniref:Importin subunit beta-1/Transportin-1-like TPR repeats domain-containing protein n=1 Tax=Pleuronectes platessa TaxID=8262 RepID=A0A9N7YLG0_PLEPL|nr:unnamed protein product [Pleuronectes platessa]
MVSFSAPPGCLLCPSHRVSLLSLASSITPSPSCPSSPLLFSPPPFPSPSPPPPLCPLLPVPSVLSSPRPSVLSSPPALYCPFLSSLCPSPSSSVFLLVSSSPSSSSFSPVPSPLSSPLSPLSSLLSPPLSSPLLPLSSPPPSPLSSPLPSVLSSLCPLLPPLSSPLPRPLCPRRCSVNENVHRSVKPQILSAFGDIALAIGGEFKKYLDIVLDTLQQASQAQVDKTDYDMVDYLNELREGCLEAYTGIIQGLKGDQENVHPDVMLIQPRVEFILSFIHHIAEDEDHSDGVVANAAGLIGDLCTAFGKDVMKLVEVRPLINDLLTEGRRSKTSKTKTLATWATKELRKLKSQACTNPAKEAELLSASSLPTTAALNHFKVKVQTSRGTVEERVPNGK